MPLSGGFIEAVGAKVVASLLASLPRALKKALAPPEREAALTACSTAGVAALVAAATPEAEELRQHLENLLHRFFLSEELGVQVGHELAPLLDDKPLDIDSLLELFAEAGYDEATLPGLDLRRALEKFEQAFLQVATQQPALQGEIRTRQSLLQTGLLGEIRDDLNHLRDLGPALSGVLQLLQAPVKPTLPLRATYLEGLLLELGRLPLAGIDQQDSTPRGSAEVQLAGVYTSLLTEASEGMELAEARLASAERLERERLSALTMLDREKYLVLLGEPGSGKTTFVHFVALCLAGEALGRADLGLAQLTAGLPAKKEGAEPPPQPWRHGPLLPLRVVLKDFATRGLPPAGVEADRDTLWHFIVSSLAKSLDGFEGALKAELIDSGALVLLDGLDEVPEAEMRREQICQAVQGFRVAFPRCRMLATCRTYAYQSQSWKLAGFAEAVLAPFEWPQISAFIVRWYQQVGPAKGLSAESAAEEARSLEREINASPSNRELAERPLLLTLMALLHTWGSAGRLPEKREQLYAAAVAVLLDLWEREKVRRDRKDQVELERPSLAQWLEVRERGDVRRCLEELAYKAHRDMPESLRTADIAEKDLVDALLSVARKPQVNHFLLVQYLSERSGLLAARGERVYAFPHRTLQEYLAACHLAQEQYPYEVARLARAQPQRWREVALLAGAKAASGTESPLWSLVGSLCPKEPKGNAEEEAWGARLAAEAILETARLVPHPEMGLLQAREPEDNDKLAWVRERQLGLLQGALLPSRERAAAGRALARLGDVRDEVLRVDSMELCRVPAGPFLWQGQEERPLAAPFWVSRFPVTQAQYGEFCAENGYRQARYWKEAAAAGVWAEGRVTDFWGQESIDGPRGYGEPFSLPNHPVVGVTWYEALAFTRWLTERWRAAGLSADWQVRLPLEVEWEKAARGGLSVPPPGSHGVIQASALVGAVEEMSSGADELVENPLPARMYPWGPEISEEHANYEATQVAATSAVGAFPLGASPYGCEELAGNVWEWCRDVTRGDVSGSKEAAVALRGGSWGHPASFLAAANRFWSGARFRDQDLGFRCVLVGFSEHD